jgi:NADH-quinone oxidoreductase subunit N
MAGIPILQVSLLNYFIQQYATNSFIALVIVAVINSIISVGYFKVILAMYKEPNEERDARCYCSCRYSDST